MTRYGALLTTVGACVLIWHECAENPAIFCYLIGIRAFTGIRSRALTLAPVTSAIKRNNSRCSNPSGSFSTTSTMSKE
jgi:hypothetical protein